jgi:hypothetical protein
MTSVISHTVDEERIRTAEAFMDDQLSDEEEEEQEVLHD